jgi:glycosyltransferase involved in cell wall biosynthesis
MSTRAITVYDALHWKSGRGMWRYRNQLIRHIEQCEFLHFQCAIPQIFNSRYPLFQILSAELIEPIWRMASPLHISIFPYNVLPIICPKHSGIRILVVCDLMFLDNRFGLSIGSFYRRFKINGSINRAETIICISETTKRNVMDRWTDTHPTVIPCALDNLFLEPFEKPKNQNKVFRILHFGGAIKSKGTALLLQAIQRLIFEGYLVELFIASMSKNPEFIHQQASHCGLDSKHYTILPRLSDAELVNLYRTCDLHCMPSLGEGFGIPVIEAASQYLPNVLSPLPVFQELMADAALYFEDWTVESIASSLKKAIATDLTSLSTAARTRALAYSFDHIQEHYARPFFQRIVDNWQKTDNAL